MTDKKGRAGEILADRFALAVCMIQDGYWLCINPDIMEPIKYLQDDVLPVLLAARQNKVTQERLDAYRTTETYHIIRRQIRTMVGETLRYEKELASANEGERGNTSLADDQRRATGAG